MASMWRQAMLYLGLGPDEQYDELDGLQHPDGRDHGEEQVTVCLLYTSPSPRD